MADTVDQFRPMRGDDVEAWIKRRRDELPRNLDEWDTLDYLLDNYRLHAGQGTAGDDWRPGVRRRVHRAEGCSQRPGPPAVRWRPAACRLGGLRAGHQRRESHPGHRGPAGR